MAKNADVKKPESGAVENPSPATEMTDASGALMEPDIKKGVDVDHPAVESNPRARTTAIQNGTDWNDPRKRKPGDKDFVGQGLDPTPYGRKAEGKK